MIAPRHKPVIVAARYSPKPKAKSDDREESIEVQLAHCRECASRYGLVVGLEICEPGISGYTSRIAEREGGRQLLDAVASGKYGAVIVARLDRLSRRTSDCLSTIEAWQERGVSLYLANQGGNTINGGTPEGMLFLTILAGFAQFERGLISRRTSDAMKKQHREKVKKGNAPRPAGYRVAADGITCEPCPIEQAAIAKIRDLTANGHTPNDIATAFAKCGNEFRGRAWSPQLIRKIVRRC